MKYEWLPVKYTEGEIAMSYNYILYTGLYLTITVSQFSAWRREEYLALPTNYQRAVRSQVTKNLENTGN